MNNKNDFEVIATERLIVQPALAEWLSLSTKE